MTDHQGAGWVPRLLLLAAVVIWGWTFVATKILLAEIGPVEVLALRLAIGLPFLGALLLALRVPLRFTRSDLRPMLVGGALFTLHFLVQISGLVTTTATNTGWIIAVSPLATLALAVPLLGEPFGPFIAIGGGLVLAGVYFGQRAPRRLS